MIKILVADDHPVIRQGLKQIIAENGNMAVAGEASNGQEVLEQVRKNHYNVVLLDISMPLIGGLDVLKQLQKEKPELAVLILSIHPEEQYAVRALRAGASGYITKDSAPQELITAIQTVSSGKKYVSQDLAQKLASRLGAAISKPPHEILSDREYSVLRLIAAGRTNARMAEELLLSPKTVSTYRARILQKLGLKTNAELVRYAMENQLVE